MVRAGFRGLEHADPLKAATTREPGLSPGPREVCADYDAIGHVLLAVLCPACRPGSRGRSPRPVPPLARSRSQRRLLESSPRWAAPVTQRVGWNITNGLDSLSSRNGLERYRKFVTGRRAGKEKPRARRGGFATEIETSLFGGSAGRPASSAKNILGMLSKATGQRAADRRLLRIALLYM